MFSLVLADCGFVSISLSRRLFYPALFAFLLVFLSVCVPRVGPGHPSSPLYSLVKMDCGVLFYFVWFSFMCSFSALTLSVGSFDP